MSETPSFYTTYNQIDEPRPKKYTSEEVVAGVVLENYVKRTPSEDGQYVTVVRHSEKIELIPQPPTPEEIAARKEQDKMFIKVFAGIGVAFFGFIGLMTALEVRGEKLKLQAAQRKTDESSL
jgi:hypothetical protein